MKREAASTRAASQWEDVQRPFPFSSPPRMNESGQTYSTGTIPLDGRLERSRFSPVVSAIIALVFAFLLFQIVISPVTLLILLAVKGISPGEMLANMDQILQQEAKALLVANTVGQVLGIGLVAYLFARLHSS